MLDTYKTLGGGEGGGGHHAIHSGAALCEVENYGCVKA